MVNILAIIGSPRKNGNINKIAKEILKGANENGHKIELINLYDYDIKPCLGCWSCVQKENCIIEDDFEAIFNKIKNADIIVLGSPVYWANVSGMMKNFFDRHTGYAMFLPKDATKVYAYSKWQKIKTALKFLKNFGPKYPSFKEKKYILITAGTVPFKHFMGEMSLTIKAMKKYVNKLKGKVIGKIQFNDTLFRFFNKKEKKIMVKALKLGKSLIG